MPPQRTRGLAFVVSYTSVGLAYGASYLLRVFLSHWCQPGGFCLCVYIYIFNLHIWKHAVATWWKKRNHKMQIIFIRYRASTLKKNWCLIGHFKSGIQPSKAKDPYKAGKGFSPETKARMHSKGISSRCRLCHCLPHIFEGMQGNKKERERERGRDGGTMEIIN